MLSTEDFTDWSQEVVLFLHNTSRCDDEPYPDLLRKKGFNGFPSLAYLDETGRVLLKLERVRSVGDLEAGHRRLEEWRRLRAAVEAGASDRRKELFLVELGLGVLDPEEARETATTLELAPKERARVERRLVEQEFLAILRATPEGGEAAAGAKLLAMFRAGRIPRRSRQITSYWQFLFEHAKAEKDVELFEELLAAVKEEMAGDERLRRYLPILEKDLEDLKRDR